MRFRLVWPGKTKDEHLRSLIEEYLKRLSRFVRVEVTEIRESHNDDRLTVTRRILDAVLRANLVVVLDERGREFTSTQLAEQIQRWEVDSVKEVAIVIGGPEGLTEEVKSRASAQWGLSRLTLTHEMARMLLVEQLYRAYTIIRGLPYQKK